MQNGFLRGVCRVLCAQAVDILRPFSRVYQYQHIIVFNLDHAGGDCCDLFRALWDAQAQCAGDDRADCVSVPGPDAVLSVRRGDRQRFARTVVKRVVGGQNMHAEAVHREASFCSCSALRTASSIVPTL